MADPRTERTARAVASWQPRTIYLTAYNILFASLWASVFVRAVSSAPTGSIGLFHATEAYARWIQTASLIEVLHAAFGMLIMVYLPSCVNEQVAEKGMNQVLSNLPLAPPHYKSSRASYRFGWCGTVSRKAQQRRMRILLCYLLGRLQTRFGTCT
jgi:hypothetical protein